MSGRTKFLRTACAAALLLLAAGCAQTDVPDGRSVSIPTVQPPIDRYKGLNEQRDAVTRVQLGQDVLVPRRAHQDPLPEEYIGPFELRGETLASALQLLLDDYDVSLAFESNLAMENRISVSNLRGKLSDVVMRICELSNLYCHYKDHVLTVRDSEIFIVDLPPKVSGSSENSSDSGSGGGNSDSNSSSEASEDSYESILLGLTAVLSGGSTARVREASSTVQGASGNSTVTTEGTTGAPVIDEQSRVIIYSATQRQQNYAEKFFERLRKNTALIIFETHIWEVALSNSNRTGIDWSVLLNRGNFGLDLQFPGGAPSATGGATPISITPSYTGSDVITPSAVLEFISEHGAVKTVSQPQITVLSGSSASFSVNQNENFVSSVTRTPSTTPGIDATFSTETDTVETGLSVQVNSAWDQSTVYSSIAIEIAELLALNEFNADPDTTIQLPKTTERTLSTFVRVRPGDAILIGGLVTQRDSHNDSGPGFMKPLFSTAKQAATANTELVFLLRPRVVAFVPGEEADTVPVTNAPRAGSVPQPVDPSYEVDGFTSGARKVYSRDVVTYDPPAPSPLPAGISSSGLAPAMPEVVGAPETIVVPVDPPTVTAGDVEWQRPVTEAPPAVVVAPTPAPVQLIPPPAAVEEAPPADSLLPPSWTNGTGQGGW